MMTVLSVAVFLGALGVSLGAIAWSIAPQWRRIADLAMGRVEQPFAPLAALAHAERRIAVRRWAGAPRPGSAPASRWLAAA